MSEYAGQLSRSNGNKHTVLKPLRIHTDIQRFRANEDNGKFFEQMDYLTPELSAYFNPGRLLCVHVKDRVLSGNATGDGMPTIDPFSDMTVFHYMKHGFRYMGRITVDTDVVRENNQTYRLGYGEMCKDGSKMGIGCPEYVLLFRKLPTDTSKAYADVRVEKSRDVYFARTLAD